MSIFILLLNILTSENYLNLLINETNDQIITEDFCLFSTNKSVGIFFRNDEILKKIKEIYAKMVGTDECYFLKNILQVDEDLLNTFLYKPVVYSISDIKNYEEYYKVVAETYDFLAHMIKTYKIVPVIDLFSIFIDENNKVKFLIKDYLTLIDDSQNMISLYFLKLRTIFEEFAYFQSNDQKNIFLCFIYQRTDFLIEFSELNRPSIYICEKIKKRKLLPNNIKISIITSDLDLYLEKFFITDEIMNRYKENKVFLGKNNNNCALFFILNKIVIEFNIKDLDNFLNHYQLKIKKKIN